MKTKGIIAADLQSRLKRLGYQVPALADTADDALRIIDDVSPDLVLMDIRIQGDMDGIELAKKLRTDFDVPVIYLTAHEDRATLERASHTQAFGYIKKPIASASLRGSIEMAIAKHKYERYLRDQINRFSANVIVPHDVGAKPQPVMTGDDVQSPERDAFQSVHDEKLEYYIGLVDQQSRMFRNGQGPMARALDEKIQHAKADYLGAARALLGHLTQTLE